MDKHKLRQTMLNRRKALPGEQRSTYSNRIHTRLLNFLDTSFPALDSLLAYRAMPDEVNADKLFKQTSYRMFAPITHHHEHMEWRQADLSTPWQSGMFGIPEPAHGKTWTAQTCGNTALICPLTAFDRQGNRLGMGKGCFDFWLARHRPQLQAVIGLAFSCQETACIPAESHDIPMDYIITESEVISCPNH